MNNKNSDLQKTKASQFIINEYRLHNYDSDNNDFIEVQNVYSPSFPVIIKSDGTIWELGALYLNYLLIEKKASSKLLKTVAYDLLDFLRFMESNNIGMLHLPEEEELRVSFRYRQNLINRKDLSKNTASQRINRIVDFYNFCFKEKLFAKEELKNRVYKKLKIRLTWFSSYGSLINEEKETTNLAIRRSARSVQTADSILDGRQLHPLTDKEQDIFEEYLSKYGTRMFQLICSLAINTGARIQPICTLRVNDIKKLIRNKSIVKGHYSLKIGDETTIDNKGGKNQKILIPIWLVEDINRYIDSEEWKERAGKSYYKFDNNYVFLSKFGNSLYTSRQEIQDRKFKLYPSNDKFVEKSGEVVRKYLEDIRIIMLKDNVNIRRFSMHDVRATFGLNLLNILKKSNLNENQIIGEIQERMGHTNRNVTLEYLNYNLRNEAYARVCEEYEKIIYRFD